MSDTAAMPRMAYLVSRYPALSHTFILREVLQLRKLGLTVETASINAPDIAPDAMPRAERTESARTWYVKRAGLAGALRAHGRTLLSSPLVWGRGLCYALMLGGVDARALLRALAYFTEALMLGQWMQRHALTHLHVHFATAAASVALILKHTFPVTLSLTVHGPDEFDNVEAHWLRRKIEAADFVVCIGHFARSQLMRLASPAHWGKIDIVRLGVDPQRYLPSTGVRRGPPRILCVGRLTPAKGQHVLIEAARRLREAGHVFELVLVGTGPDARALRRAVHEAHLERDVLFAGALNQTQVLLEYGRADLFVLPSFAEGIPVVLMEAMASGLACVSSRINGIGELICNEHEGVLLAPSDVDALTATLARLLQDPPLRARIGHAARARVEADFDLGRNVERLAALFCRRIGSASC